MRQRIEHDISAIHGLQREIELRYKIIGVRLFTARSQLGVGLRVIADRAAIDHSHLSRIERGESRPSLEVIEDLLDALEQEQREASECPYRRQGLSHGDVCCGDHVITTTVAHGLAAGCVCCVADRAGDGFVVALARGPVVFTEVTPYLFSEHRIRRGE